MTQARTQAHVEPPPTLPTSHDSTRPPQLDPVSKEIVSALFSAVIDPKRWDPLLSDIQTALKAQSVRIFAKEDWQQNQISLDMVWPLDQVAQRETFNQIVPIGWQDLQISGLQSEQSMGTDGDFEKITPTTLMTSNMTRPKTATTSIQSFEYGRVVLVSVPRLPRVSLLMFRRHRDAARFSDKDLDWLDSFSVHFARAMNSYFEIRTAQRDIKGSYSIIENISRPIGLAYGSGDVVTWNRLARFELKQSGFDPNMPHPQWKSACRSAMRIGEALLEVSDQTSLRLRTSAPFSFDGLTFSATYWNELLTVEILKSDAPTQQDMLRGVASRYKLTGSEEALLRDMSSGMTVSMVAQKWGKQPNTVRQHLKNLRRKTQGQPLTALATLLTSFS